MCRTYKALVTRELDMVQLFFLDVLKTALIPVGKVLYLDMQSRPSSSSAILTCFDT
jgi:hypothetical protein